jgi:steroid 5-alpha reductase family enzyme
MVLILLFLATWFLSGRCSNFSFVDVTWSFSFAAVALLYACNGDGWGPRRLVVCLLVSLWSLRLGFHLLRRVVTHFPKDDPRYVLFRQGLGDDSRASFLGVFLGQGLLVWLLMLPVYFICRDRDAFFRPWEAGGCFLWMVALTGEAIADAQLRGFKSRHPERSAVCQTGLWRFSRHPNYFFQFLLWVALFFIALPAPGGWLAVLAPLSMLFFLVRVTGIPLTEKLAVETKGDAYRRYQKTTSAFIPLPPRSDPS